MHFQQQRFPRGQYNRAPPPSGNNTGITRVLLVVLRKLSNPVELDRMFYIFSQFGKVEKISTFIQHQQNQVVVQFENCKDAALAKGYLNGRDLSLINSDGKEARCSLAIVPSKLPQLTFKRDDSRNRDYTAVNQQLQLILDYHLGGATSDEVISYAMHLNLPILDFLWGQWISRQGWLEPAQDPQMCGRIPVGRGLPEGKVGECVHLSGLPSDRGLTAPLLWALCGMYGELVAVKLLAQHPGCAVIQYRERSEAEHAIANLNGSRLYGSRICAQVSKNANATHWRGAQTELEQRMCTSEDMRPPAPAPRHITGPPVNVVGAWGLPAEDTIHAMEVMFGHYGPVNYADLGQGIATATFDRVETAFEAICNINGGIFTTASGYEFKACLHFANENLTGAPVTTQSAPTGHTQKYDPSTVSPTSEAVTPGYSSFSGSQGGATPLQLPHTPQNNCFTIPPFSPQTTPPSRDLSATRRTPNRWARIPYGSSSMDGVSRMA
eukprot:TRINITY_DN3004_c1_g1_i1.p1 TRINITY_DN3004_c1_g1~~TRINITY_DN3004_c1_g1_i1.p1  ORF type:complete len:514 (+),score=61.40 TRINITY_DN3004_c1_g1_i1:58-1542(+)